MITCTRVLEFDYAHRVVNHESKCRSWHGHRGRVEVTAVAEGLDELGRIIDFGVLKQKVGGWIDENWDHTCIIFEKDMESIRFFRHADRHKEPFILPFNPTAEHMADYLLREVCPKVLEGTGVTVVSVKFHETPNGMAEACLD